MAPTSHITKIFGKPDQILLSEKLFAIISIAIPIVHNNVNSLNKHA